MKIYKPYGWMDADPCDNVLQDLREVEAEKMNTWFQSLPRFIADLGTMFTCTCGTQMMPRFVDERWILKHYAHDNPQMPRTNEVWGNHYDER